jgi:hypothetical protein
MEIKARPVAKFGDGDGVSLSLVRGGPLIAKGAMSGSPHTDAMSGIPPHRPRADLAEALLRFQRKDRGEAHREAALHHTSDGGV